MNISSDELLQNFFKTGSTVGLPRIDSESQVCHDQVDGTFASFESRGAEKRRMQCSFRWVLLPFQPSYSRGNVGHLAIEEHSLHGSFLPASQFQEFMRKIPSATNLAAAMSETVEAAAAHGGGSHVPGGPNADQSQTSGVPRVPSLDFIKAFLSASRPTPDHIPGSLFGPPNGLGGATGTPHGAQQQQAFELNGSVALALGRAKLDASANEGGSEGGGGSGPAHPASSAAGGSAAGSHGGTPTANRHDRVGPHGLLAARHHSESGPGGNVLGAAAAGALGRPQSFSAPTLPIAGLQGGSAGQHMVLNPNVLAAAFMQSQLGTMAGAGSGGYTGGTGAGGTGGPPGHAAALSGGTGTRAGGGSALLPASSSDAVSAKQQVRRERRMLSNRESARRSRKRKQEHLQGMEARLTDSEKAREEAVARIAQLMEELRRRDAELGSLRVEVMSLRAALGESHPAVLAGGLAAQAAQAAVETAPPHKTDASLGKAGTHDERMMPARSEDGTPLSSMPEDDDDDDMDDHGDDGGSSPSS